MLAFAQPVCKNTMKLMGMDKLHALALGEDKPLAHAAACLAAELAAARWSHRDEAAADFPKAIFRDQRMVIRLADRHSVVLVICYRLGIALVESAGIESDVETARPMKPRTKA